MPQADTQLHIRRQHEIAYGVFFSWRAGLNLRPRFAESDVRRSYAGCWN